MIYIIISTAAYTFGMFVGFCMCYWVHGPRKNEEVNRDFLTEVFMLQRGKLSLREFHERWKVKA